MPFKASKSSRICELAIIDGYYLDWVYATLRGVFAYYPVNSGNSHIYDIILYDIK
jgi:hypothetical protein